MSKVLCIGQSTCDITIPISETILDNHKFTITEEIRSGGGPAMTAACVFGKWQSEVDLISRLGEDEAAGIILESLDKFSVNKNKLIIEQTAKTPYSYVYVNQKDGNRTIFNNPGVRVDRDNYEIEPNYRLILTDGRELDLSMASFAANPQAIKVIDAGTCREVTVAIARKVDYLVCSKYFAEQYSGRVIGQDLENIREIFTEIDYINRAQAVITLGDQGLVFKDEEGKIKQMPAYQVRPVDTTGAGDIFHGAFSWALIKGKPYVETLKIASIAAALSTEQVGGQASIPSLDRVLQISKEWQPQVLECK